MKKDNVKQSDNTENNSKDLKPHLFKKGKSGNPAGRPKTTKKRKEALKEFKSRVRKNVNVLFNAQYGLAMGCSFLFRIKTVNKGKKNERRVKELVKDKHTIMAYFNEELEDEDDYYYISTQKPDSRAIDSLLDRTFGKAMQSTKIKGEGINAIGLLLKSIYDAKEPAVKKYPSSLGDVERKGIEGKDKEPEVAVKQPLLDKE